MVLDATKILSYGGIGLGFLLAFLAFILLSNEQKRIGQPRHSMIRAIYTFMLFSLCLAAAGFFSQTFAYISPRDTLGVQAFSQIRPVPLFPANRSELKEYPRLVSLSWEDVAGAASYRVEAQVQVEVVNENRVEWDQVTAQQIKRNNLQIEFPGAQWGRWRVSAISKTGDESQPSEWSLFRFLR
ncbi:hypothetical protein [Methylocystis sp. JR02]|uniref:hypothetical protein n=1 Tax=Methylocystis sp. JR02 TaxID=3046284 RepID=UPI0024BA6E0C|nr:hypothetical protein [Methylocystis sp. JR02]MDJ0449850.1 hypothetical protein [Methylocystis sp. JR02]